MRIALQTLEIAAGTACLAIWLTGVAALVMIVGGAA